MKPQMHTDSHRRFRFASLIGVYLCASVVSTSRAADAPFERVAIDTPGSVWSVEAVDINADGKLDIIAMGETRVWALVAPTWERHTIADVEDGKLLYCVALDADGDGDRDIAVGRFRVPWIWYRQQIAKGKSPGKPDGPDFSVAWIENTGRLPADGDTLPLHPLDRELNGIHGMTTGDVDGDGRVDLIADSIMGPKFGSSVAWFAAPLGSLDGETPVKRRVIARGDADGRPHYMDFADITGDGRGDLLLGASSGGTFRMWSRDRSGAWKRTTLAKEPGATNIRAADVNDDGRQDAVISNGHGSGVAWLEGPTWKRHAIDDDIRDAHCLVVADLNGDGHTDAAACSYTQSVTRVYFNDGHGAFRVITIDTGNEQQAYDMKATDLDGDEATDLLLAGRNANNVVWYRNTRE